MRCGTPVSQKIDLLIAYPFLLVYLSQRLYQESWYHSAYVIDRKMRDEGAQHLAKIQPPCQCQIWKDKCSYSALLSGLCCFPGCPYNLPLSLS